MQKSGATIQLVGVLNLTPDSFSDGGKFLEPAAAMAQAKLLISQGASVVELGADSTRPGSVCVGTTEEWRRLSPILPEISKLATTSVDTHFAVTARAAIDAGAKLINDVSGGTELELLAAVAEANVKVVLMHSISPPHEFDHLKRPSFDLLSLKREIREFFKSRIKVARSCGVRDDQIILDPGMGAFISPNSEISFAVAQQFFEFADMGYAMMFAVSRKGFLKRDGEINPSDRDPLSALLAAATAFKWSSSRPLYIRVHNLSLHNDLLRRLAV